MCSLFCKFRCKINEYVNITYYQHNERRLQFVKSPLTIFGCNHMLPFPRRFPWGFRTQKKLCEAQRFKMTIYYIYTTSWGLRRCPGITQSFPKINKIKTVFSFYFKREMCKISSKISTFCFKSNFFYFFIVWLDNLNNCIFFFYE